MRHLSKSIPNHPCGDKVTELRCKVMLNHREHDTRTLVIKFDTYFIACASLPQRLEGAFHIANGINAAGGGGGASGSDVVRHGFGRTSNDQKQGCW